MESRTGVLSPLPESRAFTWRKRACGLAIFSPSSCVARGDQSDHVLSGLLVLPLRVATRTAPPAASACHRTRPQEDDVSVSFTLETKVPSALGALPRSYSMPGLDVATT